MPVSWSRVEGYEVSTRGDARFSAFRARLADGRSIEEVYQCDVKGYDPGGRDWRRGKGRPGLYPTDLWAEYMALWRSWAKEHPELIAELMQLIGPDGKLRDRFASTPINQARALAVLLNEEN